ncbi:cation-translocating P-type ATPase [Mycoplasmoides pirum]|uniref:cation-translocating P-type ATPase n=1 Tax=Mycoplasmoides pirum TaxID=2122 RepID=UPI000695F649|nr:cation-translocating P-type ATPase [Mycoplasmoides pirum]
MDDKLNNIEKNDLDSSLENKEESKFSIIHVNDDVLKKAESEDILDELVVEGTIDNLLLTSDAKDIQEEIVNDSKYEGLTSEKVDLAIKKYGLNKLPEKKKKSVFYIFFKQLKDIMILLLAIATLASFIVFIVEGVELKWDFNNNNLIISLIEPFIILIVILMYVILGGVQELQSLKAINSLKKLSTNYATVIRDNNIVKINAENLVPGDLMLLEAGDKINADAILLESFNLSCIESILTGESLAVNKNANAIVSDDAYLGDQINKVFSGCIVTNGQAKCKVIATGSYTQIGRIANLIDSQKVFMTPLQLKLNRLGHIFGYSGLVLFVVVFLIQIFILGINNIATTWNIALATSISLAVAAIPEGLGAFTTIILSLGIKRMASQNALIKKVSSVETLGSTSVICTDKTGTLTLNKMTLTGVWDYQNKKELDLDKSNLNLNNLLRDFILCSNSYVTTKDNKDLEVGDPTELAIINYARQHNLNKLELDKKFARIYAIPFDSDRKLMTSINEIDGKKIAIVKGAPDILINKCKNVDLNAVKEQMQLWTSKAYRVLGLAIKDVTHLDKKYDESSLENDLTFVGLFAMYDPPRPEVKEAIKECIGAGIKTVMITGDNLDSAKAIAKEIGILKIDSEAISGEELSKLTDEELQTNVVNYSVYARATPSDKLRIVKAWQANDQVVAMTGDGVNDAPSLKAADIGCAMGITGTDVSKEASDMIIMDDNFKTIVSSVSNGRKVYQTIKLVIQNVLLSSVAEVMVMFLGVLIFKYAFSSSLQIFDQSTGTWSSSVDLHIFGATQLLVINLITDGFPAIALGIQGTQENLMFRRPYSKYESIFARRMGFNLLWQGCLFGLITMIAFALGTLYSRDHWFGNTMNGLDPITNQIIPGSNGLYALGFNDLYAGSATAFIALSIGISIHALSLMSSKSLFKCNVKDYYIVYSAVLISILFVIIFAFVPPIAFALKIPTNLVSQGGFLIGIGFVLALVPWIVLELYKLIYAVIQKEVLTTSTITTFELIQKPKLKTKRYFKNKQI